MSLISGTRLGPYEIVGALGAGGMGEVYRARDTKLGRDVALKVLPESFATDPDRLARFQREAQVLAALNHPNIAHIYGLEEATSSGPAEAGHYRQRALVMELVEGPTLADRIAQGAISLDEALPIARQIAEALEAAHGQGIIHRDLKPANIKVRPDGTVKVLDFGLAKALGPAEAGHYGDPGSVRLQADLSHSPTITSPAMMTGVGMILGTAAYMSPEQAKGRPADKRADIWAFGCVLYEMLAGRRPFEGDDVSDTLASVLKSDPQWSALPAEVPVPIRRLLRRCLAKDPKLRVPDIAIARYEIDEALAAPSPESGALAAAPIPKASRLRRGVPIAAAGVISGIVVGLAMWVLGRTAPQPLVRLTATPPAAATVGGPNTADSDLAISPDGRRIVYVGVGDGVATPQLYVRALDQLDAKSLQGLGSPRSPFISPDGNSVGFFDGAVLKKVAINGGPPVTICGIGNFVPRGASWGADDTIVFATNEIVTGLLRVSARGGKGEALTKPDAGKGEGDHILPEILPDGRAVLFTIVPFAGGIENAQIAVLDLRTGQQKILIQGGSNPHYAESGRLVYAVGGTLRAVPFDVNRLEVRGDPVPVVEHVVTKATTGAVSFGMARNGTLAYLAGDSQSTAVRTLAWVDRQGREEAVGVPPRTYAYPRLSPDGTRIALDIRDQQNDIWIWDLMRRTLTRLTFDPGLNREGVWSPDGQRVAFSAQREGSEEVYWQAADGTGTPERLSQGIPGVQPMSFSPDGTRLLFNQSFAPMDIYSVLLKGEHRVEPLLHNSAYNEQNPEISPTDGRWLAYQSNESGQDEIYVRPFPNVDSGRWQVSTGGGRAPLWAQSGRELFYWVGLTGASAGQIMSVPIQAGATFSSGTPQKLVAGPYLSPQGGRPYDVSADGKRFLVIKDATLTSATPTQLVVVLNWFEELKRLTP